MSALRRRTNRIRRFPGRRGAAAVEFAMTVPILFMLLFAALELGRMNMIRQTANNAAYEAARDVRRARRHQRGRRGRRPEIADVHRRHCGDTVTVTPATITDTTPLGDGDGGRSVQQPTCGSRRCYSNNRSASVTCTHDPRLGRVPLARRRRHGAKPPAANGRVPVCASKETHPASRPGGFSLSASQILRAWC